MKKTKHEVSFLKSRPIGDVLWLRLRTANDAVILISLHHLLFLRVNLFVYETLYNTVYAAEYAGWYTERYQHWIGIWFNAMCLAHLPRSHFLTYLWMVLFLLSNDARSEFGYSFCILVSVAPKDVVFSDRLSKLFNLNNEIPTKQCKIKFGSVWHKASVFWRSIKIASVKLSNFFTYVTVEGGVNHFLK